MGKEPESMAGRRGALAKRLADIREYLGLSQREVADATDLSRNVISAIETGRRRVESVELESLARAYRLEVSYFLGTESEDEPDQVRYIARAAKDLAEEDRTELLRFARFLKSHRQTP